MSLIFRFFNFNLITLFYIGIYGTIENRPLFSQMGQIRTVPILSHNLNFNPVFLFLLSTFCIMKFTTFSYPITISSFFALVIPVYSRFLVISIGVTCGITIITTSNSLPLCFVYCYAITVFYLV